MKSEKGFIPIEYLLIAALIGVVLIILVVAIFFKGDPQLFLDCLGSGLCL